MTKRNPFTNKSIRAPKRYKPHICLREGWWRVSALVRTNMHLQHRWQAAHNFINMQNEKSRR